MKHYAIKTYGEMDVYPHVFLTSALAKGEWSTSRPGRFTPGERAPGSHWIGGWEDPTIGLNDVKRRKILLLLRLELQILGRPARTQSLYRLSYPSSEFEKVYLRILIQVKFWRQI
jgi:hypothetical protein